MCALCDSPAAAACTCTLAELFNGSRVDEKCDIYSLGCIIYECVTGKAPWSELNSPAAPPKPPRPPAPPSSSGQASSSQHPHLHAQQQHHNAGGGNGSGSQDHSNSNKDSEEGGAAAGGAGGGAVMPQGGMGALFQVSLWYDVVWCGLLWYGVAV